MSEGDSHESDILFCPFCGDVDALEVQHLEGAILYPAYRVACDNCGAAFAIRSDIDEWNQRALPAVQPDADELVGHMTKLIAAGLDRVEQLTAERDEAWAYMSAAQGDLYDAIMIEAERDRYRKALEDIIADCEAEYPPSHGAIKYAARAAMKGETP